MRLVSMTVFALLAILLAGQIISMLPPDTFGKPIFAAQGNNGDDSTGENTEFA